MEISNIILTDEGLNAVDNGIWVADLYGAPGVSLLVTGIRGTDAQNTLKRKQAKLRLENDGKRLDEDQMAQAMRETLAESVLRGWRGFTNNGSEVPYSMELATQWLTSRNGEQFVGLVLSAAQRVDSQANKLVEEASKN